MGGADGLSTVMFVSDFCSGSCMLSSFALYIFCRNYI